MEDEEDSESVVLFEDYHNEMVECLAWLLAAKERIVDLDKEQDDQEEVKNSYYHHETFIIELEEFRKDMEGVLNHGKQLIDSDIFTHEQMEQIQKQRDVLRQLWLEVSSTAIKKREEIQQKLMNFQQKNIDDLRKWLTHAEDKISRFPEIACDLDQLTTLLEDHKVSNYMNVSYIYVHVY